MGKIRRPTGECERQEAEGHACSLMHRYHDRAVSLTLLFELVDSAASYKRSRSLLRIFLSKLRKHDLEDNRISLSTVGSKQSFLTEAFDRVEHRYINESGTASESAKRAHVFAGLYSSVHSSVSFGGSGLLMTARNILRLSPSSPFASKYAAAVTTASV